MNEVLHPAMAYDAPLSLLQKISTWVSWAIGGAIFLTVGSDMTASLPMAFLLGPIGFVVVSPEPRPPTRDGRAHDSKDPTVIQGIFRPPRKTDRIA